LVAGCQLVGNLQNIISRRLDPQQSGVVTIGTIKSGDSYNVIPSKAYIAGTSRCFNPRTKQQMRGWLEHISKTPAEQFGVSAEVVFAQGYGAVYNHGPDTRTLKSVVDTPLPNVTTVNNEPALQA